MTTRDLLTLTKFRLSALVIVTTFVGFWAHR
jgi:heme O synthase-like polyprenyltransferase